MASGSPGMRLVELRAAVRAQPEQVGGRGLHRGPALLLWERALRPGHGASCCRVAEAPPVDDPAEARPGPGGCIAAVGYRGADGSIRRSRSTAISGPAPGRRRCRAVLEAQRRAGAEHLRRRGRRSDGTPPPARFDQLPGNGKVGPGTGGGGGAVVGVLTRGRRDRRGAGEQAQRVARTWPITTRPSGPSTATAAARRCRCSRGRGGDQGTVHLPFPISATGRACCLRS